MAIPYINHVDTLGLYFVAYFFEVLCTFFITCITNIEVALVLMIADELNNVIVDFCEGIQRLTLKYEAEFGLYCDNLELIQQFDRDLVVFIKEHNEIYG